MRLATTAALFLLLFACVPVFADYFDYPDFSDPTGLNIVGDAGLNANTIDLTTDAVNKVGGMWYDTQVPVTTRFESTFQFQITYSAGSGADGMAFVIQNSSANALGTGGSGMGYVGIPSSIAIEFDTYTSSSDPDANHIAVLTRGDLPNDYDHQFALGQTSSIPDLSDGNTHTAKIQYNGGSLSVFLDDLNSPVLTVLVNLSDLFTLAGGTHAYVGLTAATGGETERHRILSWSFTNTALACGYGDEFNDDVLSADWQYVKPAWSESAGQLQATPSKAKAVAWLNGGLADCANCTRHISVTMSPGSLSKVWMLGWQVDKANRIEIIGSPDTDKWVVKQRSGNTVVAKGKGFRTIDFNVEYNLYVAYDGTTIRLFVDDPYTPLVTVNAVGLVQPGTTGLQIKNTSGSFDNLCVDITGVISGPTTVTSFTAVPPQVMEGQSTTLAWATENATSCSIDNSIGTVPCNGNTNFVPFTDPAPGSILTYTLTANGPGGIATASTTVSYLCSISDVDPLFTGNFVVVIDAWADYHVGDIVPLTAEDANPLIFYIRSTNNPFIANPNTSYMKVTVDPSTGNATVASNECFDYGPGFCLNITGAGRVNTCTGGIDLIVNYGGFTGYRLVLSKQ